MVFVLFECNHTVPIYLYYLFYLSLDKSLENVLDLIKLNSQNYKKQFVGLAFSKTASFSFNRGFHPKNSIGEKVSF